MPGFQHYVPLIRIRFRRRVRTAVSYSAVSVAVAVSVPFTHHRPNAYTEKNITQSYLNGNGKLTLTATEKVIFT